jgi:hypothetical protein
MSSVKNRIVVFALKSSITNGIFLPYLLSRSYPKKKQILIVFETLLFVFSNKVGRINTNMFEFRIHNLEFEFLIRSLIWPNPTKFDLKISKFDFDNSTLNIS